MMEDPENLTLVYLRRLDAKMDKIINQVDGLTVRTAALEGGLATVIKQLGGLMETDAHLASRVDNMERRLDRIEHRLDLHDGPPQAAE